MRLFSSFIIEASWMRLNINIARTPNEPTRESFIALSLFFLFAYNPSKVSIKPSIWRPPVKIYPLTKQIIALAIKDQELLINNWNIRHWIKPIIKPKAGENCAIFLNFGFKKGSSGNIV